MKQLQFPILTYIDVTVKELDIMTTTLTDTSSEVTFFQDFLLPKLEQPQIDKLELRAFIPPLHT